MCGKIIVTPHSWRGLALCVFIACAAARATAQDAPPAVQPSPTPQAQPTPPLERRFFADILSDQRALWTAPLHLGRGDAKWLAPLGLSTAVLLATDRASAGEMLEGSDHQTRLRLSRAVSQAGSFYTTGGIAATFYLLGRTRHDARARETGLLGLEALADSGLLVEALKLATRRPRPPVDDASGEFFDHGSSFPSGHAISAWALAAVVAREYGRQHPLVRFGAYGLAAAVSLSRYTGRNHFLSDVLVGSAAGYSVGRFVYSRHHDAGLDVPARTVGPTPHSKLVPLIAPQIYNAPRGAHAYGLRLSWSL